MNIFNTLLLGVVEGVSEFLPVSSTAHLILTAKLLAIQDSEFLKSFEIIIQLGAILAVVTLYFKSFFDISRMKVVVAGFMPTAVLGLVFYKAVKSLLGDVYVVLASLLIGGIIMILFEKYSKHDEVRSEVTIRDAVKIGCFQALAFIPGTSRSAATIIGGMLLGISRPVIAEFSFLLAVPTMFAASALDIWKNKSVILNGNVVYLLVGFVTAYIVAMFSIKMFINYLKKHDFKPFGVYRIAISIVGFVIIYSSL